MYSFGVILWEVLARKQPFKELNAFAISYQVGTQGRLLPIGDIDSRDHKLGQTTNCDSSEQPPGSTRQHSDSETDGHTWWRSMLQDCFREARDRPAVDAIIARLHEATAKSRPPVSASVATQSVASKQQAPATNSGVPSTHAPSGETATTIGKTEKEQHG